MTEVALGRQRLSLGELDLGRRGRDRGELDLWKSREDDMLARRAPSTRRP